MFVNCFYCGKKVYKKPSHILKYKHHFCCKQCYNKWLLENTPKGKRNPRYKRIKKYCKQCGKEFEVIPAKVKNNKGKFCSKECFWKWSKIHPKIINRTWWELGLKHPMKGRHHTIESKRKISKANKGKLLGKNNPFFGKKHSKKVKEYISNISKKNWENPEFIKKVIKGLHTKPNNCRNLLIH